MSAGLKLEQQEGNVPPGWDLVAIDEVCTLGGGKTPRKGNDDYWHGSIPWVSPKDFDGVTLGETEDNLTQAGVSENSINLYESGDIAMVVRSGVLRHSLPVAQLESDMAVNQDIKVLQPDSERIASDYLLNILLYEADRIRASCVKTGTTVESVETAFLKAYKLPLPPLPEQRRIADILSTVDEQIQQTDEMIEKRAELLTGLKQDLLFGREITDQQEIQMGPKSVRIPSSWNVAKLGDVGRDGEKSFVDGDWVESDDMVEDGEYQLIQLGNIGIGEFKGECDKFVSERFFQEKNCTLVEQGDLLISRLADPVLRTIEVPEFEKKSITAVDIVVAKIDESSWDKRYLRFLLNSKVMSDVGGALATGSTRQRISRKNMEGITIPEPPRTTQSEIAEVLEATKTKIQIEKKHKQCLQELKRGLMQDLLTGKVRVNTD